MVQSFNWPGIWATFRVAFKPQKLVPRLIFKNVSMIDWHKLKLDHGIKAVCLDKDNTITAPYQLHAHAIASESLASCKRVFGDNVVVYSNSCGAADYDKNYSLAERFEKLNGVSVLRHATKKPDGISKVLEHFPGIRPQEIAFVGDRLLTDVLMANEAGLFSILVSEALTVQGDNLPAVLIRYFEKRVLQIIDSRSLK